jgi:subtilase family serine protease
MSRSRPRRSRRRTAPWQAEALEPRTLLSTAWTPTPDLVDVGKVQAAHTARPSFALSPRARPFNRAPVSGAYNPAQIRPAYGFDKVAGVSYSGSGSTLPGYGQTIAIVDAYDDPNIASDLATFDTQYGIPAPPSFTKINQNGSTSQLPGRDWSGGWELEEALDVEWAHAIAPGANIVLVEANSASNSDLLTAVQAAADYAGVSVVSMSWGGGEFSGEGSNDSTFTTPSGHAPDAFVASSGDSGAPVGWPAVSPNVLAVGGTTLKLTGSGSSSQWASETGWSGSGGGLSQGYEPQPGYQQGVVTQSTTARANPDVAYDADPSTGFSVYDSYPYYFSRPNWTAVGGTSAGAPQWAALLAIADQARASASPSLAPLTTAATVATPANSALAQSVLYGLFSTSGYASTYFHDITSGSSTGKPTYAAAPGYDLVTGLGTPRADGVVAALVNPPPPAPLTAPTLTATPDHAGPVSLSWNAVPGATSYEVDVMNPGTTTFTALTTTTGTSVENTGVTAGQAYTYQVVARNATQSATSSPVTVTAPTPTPLFSDGFTSSASASNWTTVGATGSWQSNVTGSNTTASNGVLLPANSLSQTYNNPSISTTYDPQAALAKGVTTGANSSVMVTARLAITSWDPGEYARAGLSVFTAANGKGLGVVVRDNRGTTAPNNQPVLVQFLDDGVTFGNSFLLPTPLTVSATTPVWYDLCLEVRGGVLYANLWQDGTAEPSTWQYSQAGWVQSNSTGAVALHGSSAGVFQTQPYSGATTSFSNVVVTGSV